MYSNKKKHPYKNVNNYIYIYTHLYIYISHTYFYRDRILRGEVYFNYSISRICNIQASMCEYVLYFEKEISKLKVRN
jgi:hypothetical protein